MILNNKKSVCIIFMVMIYKNIIVVLTKKNFFDLISRYFIIFTRNKIISNYSFSSLSASTLSINSCKTIFFSANSLFNLAFLSSAEVNMFNNISHSTCS